MRVILALVLVLLAFAIEEPDDQVEEVSHFLLQLIEKYDHEGKGYILVGQYPKFLAEVFLKGQSKSGTEIPQQTKKLLLEAAQVYTTKYNTTQVGVQQFYNDLLKDFSVFLSQEKEKYASVIDTFFGDLLLPQGDDSLIPQGEDVLEIKQEDLQNNQENEQPNENNQGQAKAAQL